MMMKPMFFGRQVMAQYFRPHSNHSARVASLYLFSTQAEAKPSTSSVKSTPKVKNNKPRHTAKGSPAAIVEPQNIFAAIELVQSKAWANFDETVEIALVLGVDPRKPNQSIRGVATLPFGTGKKVRIAVFASGNDAAEALAAGADVVGAEDLLARVQTGDTPFDRVIATPEMMPLLSKVGKILGPRGLMPNPKMGTVTKEVAKAVKSARAGAVQFRIEKQGVLQAGIGKVSFSHEALIENIRSFMVAVSDAKPENFKGKYFISASVSSTMGPGIPTEVATVDPTNAKFMLHPSLYKT